MSSPAHIQKQRQELENMGHCIIGRNIRHVHCMSPALAHYDIDELDLIVGNQLDDRLAENAEEMVVAIFEVGMGYRVITSLGDHLQFSKEEITDIDYF